MKRIVVLGSTGSIGTQTLDVVRRHPDRLKVVGLAAGQNAELLQVQAQEFGVTRIALSDGPASIRAGVPGGLSALVDLASMAEADLVVVSVAGVVGLAPTMAAIKAGKQVALASKEVLVAAGEPVMAAVSRHGTVLTPIDSEHSAIFQCLQGYSPDQVDSLILTASGGPFRGRNRAELANITAHEALNHPTWKMGGKITVDSATLMNKGLELIEAHWLFALPVPKIDVCVHPQSVIHSMVRFNDGSVLGQLGWPDMRLPIQYALLYPDRLPSGLPGWNPVDTPSLTFELPDRETFRCLALAEQAAQQGGSYPCALNAANEEAANSFLAGKCGFLQIAEVVEETLAMHTGQPAEIESLLEVDGWARETARTLMALGRKG